MNREIMGKVAATAVDGVWVRASRCTPNNNCIELRVDDGVVAVRDSKNVDGLPLAFRSDHWIGFLQTIIR